MLSDIARFAELCRYSTGAGRPIMSNALSDAYHFKLGDRDVMVACLIEITRAGTEGAVHGTER